MFHADVTKQTLPPSSALHDRVRNGDFLDCYGVASTMGPREAAEIVVAFPRWARALVALRGVVTAPFGLINDLPDSGDAIGIFPVESETDTEVIAGFDDKHLDFRVSVMADGQRVTLATWVHPHNAGGRLYLTTILPFHIAISRDALARVARASAAA